MADNEHEKIIYDIEVRVEQAKQALQQLRTELKQNHKEDLLVNLKILGTENFNTIKQNLSEVRRAIEVLEKRNTKLTLNGVDVDLTLQKLRALEKELEDFQSKVNKGSLNNQLKEQQKLAQQNQKALSDYYKQEEQRIKSQSAQHKQAYKEWSNTETAKQQKMADNQKALDDYYKQEEQRIKAQTTQHKQAYNEWNKSETAKEKLASKNRKANDQYYVDEAKRMQENSARSLQTYQQVAKAEQGYNNILDEINRKKQLGIQLSEREYAIVEKRLNIAKQNVVSAGGRTQDLPTLQSRQSYNQEAMGNYFGNVISKSMFDLSTVTSYSEKMSKLSKTLDTLTYAWERSGKSNDNYRKMMIQTEAEINKTAQALNKLHQSTGKAISGTDKIMAGLRTHATWILSSVVASVPLILPGFIMNTMKNLESQFATVEQVMPQIEEAHMASLNKDLSEMQRMEGLKTVNKEMQTFIDIGSKFGVAVEEVIESGASIGRMYGQGENGVTNTNLLTQQAARISVADNFPMIQATKGLEAALSQFQLQTEDTNRLLINSNRIIDVWTTAAHKGAASANDLTQGVQRAGAAAHQAGISFEFLNALISTGVRATGRSGNEIGNSIKSFINSMQSDKSIAALKDFGINVYKDNGDGTQSLRSMESIILDISRMIKTTNKDTSNLLLTLSGGKYQVSNLTAILKDYKELVRMTQVLNSSDVIGFTDKQIEIQLNTLSRKLESLGTNFKGLFASVDDNGFLGDLKSIVDVTNDIISGIKEMDIAWSSWIKQITVAIVALKGIPFLVNNVARGLGRFNGAWNASTDFNKKQNIASGLGIHWDDNYDKGKASVTNVDVSKQTKEETKATKDNSQAKKENTVVSKAQEATTKTTTVAVTNATTATKGFTVATRAATVASRTFSAISAAFGGPIGIVITALSIVIPLILEYADSLGKETEAHKKLIDGINEETAKREQANEAKIRAIDAAENLATQYEQLYQSSLNVSNSSKQQANINDDLSATFDALESMVSSLSKENEQYTVEADANGKIILKLNGQVVNSFNDLKTASTKLTVTSLENDRARLNSELEKTKGIIEATQKRIEQYKDEAEALNTLQTLTLRVSRFIWQKRSEAAKDTASKLQEILNSPTNTASAEERANMQARIENLNSYANKADEEYANESGKLGDLSGLQNIIDKARKRESELTGSLLELDTKIADLRGQINNNSYNTGGADSYRGDGIVDVPEDSKSASKKSKAQKEAEKLAKQQDAYNKIQSRIGIIADETSLLNNLKSIGTGGGLVGGSFNSGNAEIDRAISEAAQKYGIDENRLHALIQKESSYNVYAGQGSAYQGLGQISTDKLLHGEDIFNAYDNIMASARYFKQMLDMAGGSYHDAYVKYNEGPYGNHSAEAERNATQYDKLYSDIENNTSQFGQRVEQRVNSQLLNAEQWAQRMADMGEYYGDNGCTAFVKAFLEQMDSSFSLTQEDMYVPNLYNNVKNTDKFTSKKSGFNSGDVVIVDTDNNANEPDHVVIADGQGGYWGNSTGQKKVVHGNLSDFRYIYGAVNTGSMGGSYQAPLTDSQFVKNLLSAYGVDQEKMYNLRNVKDINSMLSMTDAMGMNLRYGQRAPIAGDILYTTDGKAYVVNSNGGYSGINGEKGNSWQDLQNRTDTYTSWIEATGTTLENATSKLSSLKLPEKLDKFLNATIDRSQNEIDVFFENIDKNNKRYERNKQHIFNRKEEYGQFDFEANVQEHTNAVDQLSAVKKISQVYTSTFDKMQNQVAQAFGSGILKEKLDNSGFASYTELSDKGLQDLANEYSNLIQDGGRFKNLVSGMINFRDKSEEAKLQIEELALNVQKLEGTKKNPLESLQDTLDNIERRTNLWKASYGETHGSFEGLNWQTNKREHDDALKQIEAYRKALQALNDERAKYVKAGKQDLEVVKQLDASILEQQTKLNEAINKAKQTQGKLSRESQETLSDMLYSLIKGGKSFKDIWNNIWDSIAEVAIKRLVGIKDATNDVWDLVGNIFGFGRPNLNSVEKGEAGRAVDTYNINNNTVGSAAVRQPNVAERVGTQFTTGGIVDYYSSQPENRIDTTLKESAKKMENASNTIATASQIEQQNAIQDTTNTMQDTTNTMQDTTNTIQDTANGVQETINTTQDTTNTVQGTATAQTQQVAVDFFNRGVGTFQSAANQISTAATNSSTTSSVSGGKGGGIGSYLGLIPSVLSLFANGGSLEGFAKGGHNIKGGGKIKGAGTHTSDSILAYLSNQGKFIAVSDGEYIMNADATRKYGNILEQMNLGEYADGGSISSEPYIPTLKNPKIANNIIQKEAQKQNNNAKMEQLLGQQNLILTNIAKQGTDNSGGNVTILNTKASKEEIYAELAKDPRALQKLIYGNQKRGFR